MSEQYWLEEDGGINATESGDSLLINGGHEVRPVPLGSDYTISPVFSGVCAADDIIALAEDHSWIGSGLISLDGDPAINASLSLLAQVDAQPVAKLVLGSRPDQWAWRVRGWSLKLETSDLTPQVLALAMAGGGVCINARLTNQANSQLLGLRINARAVVLPVDQLDALSSGGTFKNLTLTGQVIGTPQIDQELAA